ncbi:hypothetical protein ABT284_31600, partial [Nocardioides sp. NPDC000441]
PPTSASSVRRRSSAPRSSSAWTTTSTCSPTTPSRYIATYAFFRDGLEVASARLRAYVHGGDSSYLDEPATAAALAAFVLRGVECGAVAADEVETLAGIDQAKLAELARRRITA